MLKRTPHCNRGIFDIKVEGTAHAGVFVCRLTDHDRRSAELNYDILNSAIGAHCTTSFNATQPLNKECDKTLCIFNKEIGCYSVEARWDIHMPSE